MQVFLQYSVFSGLCTNCTKSNWHFSTSFRDLTLDISKAQDYNGHIKNEGGARDEALRNGSDESVEPYRCSCVRTGLFLRSQGIRIPCYLLGRCHSGRVHFYLPAYEPYRTGRACGACTSCTCRTHYAATEYGRKQKCAGCFQQGARCALGRIKGKRLCFLQSRYCFDYGPSLRQKLISCCRVQLKNISQMR